MRITVKLTLPHPGRYDRLQVIVSKRKTRHAISALFLILLTLGSLVSCRGGRGSGLRRYDLFTISLGTLPGELDWFYRDGYRMAGAADIESRDGLVFLSGAGSGKVMVFNSYGDLITYVYDPSRSLPPAVSDSGEGIGSVTGWPLRDPGFIAAWEGGFLVEDGVEQERRVEDTEFGTLYDRVVLRFDRDGAYQGHLGREGLGGSPFPYIDSLDVRDDGGIVVTCRVPGAWTSYWFSADGYPVTTIRIREDQLPGRAESDKVAVYSVKPDPVEWKLRIRLDAYPADARPVSPEPRLYSLDLSTLEYSDPIILSYNNPSEDSGVPAIPPEYLGTTSTGEHMMLSSEGPDLYRMTLVDNDGRVVQNRRLKVEADAAVYRKFSLQNNGLLTGLFIGAEKASVAWWRIDRIID